MHNWKKAEPVADESRHKFPDIHPVILQLLWNRGLKKREDIDRFLQPQYENLHDPFIFRDMEKFVSRIRQAVNANETIFVYGDYDADGVCSAALLAETLGRAGVKKVEVYIPHREREGYGLNVGAIDFIANAGGQLIITVDCGSGNWEEVIYALKRGLEVIIIDHHEEPPRLPESLAAFLNPKLEGETYPWDNLAAVGVTFKVVQALWRAFNLPLGQEKWLLDLVAIATITDMMPLLDENRILAHYGLQVLNKTRRPGLAELIRVMGSAPGELDVYDVGFKIGPRLNAAGRLDHANTAYELLTSVDQTAIHNLALALNSTNASRQAETSRIIEEANAQIEEQLPDSRVLVAVGHDWPVGVVGLVAGKITEQFYRPTLVITRSEEKLVGSGRSIPPFNITAALGQASEHLARWGGHSGACGFTLKGEEAIAPLGEALNVIAGATLSADDFIKSLAIDAELSFADINWDLVNALAALAPFGIGNPRPKFVSYQVGVREAYPIGNNGQHLRLVLQSGNIIIEAVSFGTGEEWGGQLRPGDLIDIVYEVDVNEWQGRKKIQLKVVDIDKNKNSNKIKALYECN